MNMRKRNQIPCAVCVLRIRVPWLRASELQAGYSSEDVAGKEERALRLKSEGWEDGWVGKALAGQALRIRVQMFRTQNIPALAVLDCNLSTGGRDKQIPLAC